MQVANEEQKSGELMEKYARVHVDLVIAASSVSLRFVQRHRAAIWPHAPVVYYSRRAHVAGQGRREPR